MPDHVRHDREEAAGAGLWKDSLRLPEAGFPSSLKLCRTGGMSGSARLGHTERWWVEPTYGCKTVLKTLFLLTLAAAGLYNPVRVFDGKMRVREVHPQRVTTNVRRVYEESGFNSVVFCHQYPCHGFDVQSF